MFLWILFNWTFLLHDHMSSFCKIILCNLFFECLTEWSKTGKIYTRVSLLLINLFIFLLFSCKHYKCLDNSKCIYSYKDQKFWSTLDFSMNQNVVSIYYLLLLIVNIGRFIRRLTTTTHKLPCGHTAFPFYMKFNISIFISYFIDLISFQLY